MEVIFTYNYSEYYKYLVGLVEPPNGTYTLLGHHRELLFHLWAHEFYWLDIYREEDRANDGTAIRDRFLHDYDMPPIAVPQGPCNVLEMLIALALRIDIICRDWDVGAHPWDFLEMFIENLGLSDLTDDDISGLDTAYISAKLEAWMSHAILPNGDGGLFRFAVPVMDINRLSTWDMMQHWLVESMP